MRKPTRRLGVVTVELALLAPVLLLLLFGTVELGWLACEKALLSLSARAAVRVAGLGLPTDQVVAEVFSTGENLNEEALTVTLDYRIPDGEGGWSDWQPLANVTQGSETVNSAPPGAQVRVTLTYVHQLLVPSLFGMLADDPDGRTRNLHEAAVTRRE